MWQIVFSCYICRCTLYPVLSHGCCVEPFSITRLTVRKFTITKARALASIHIFFFHFFCLFCCCMWTTFFFLYYFYFFFLCIYIENFAYVNSWHAYFRKSSSKMNVKFKWFFYSFVILLFFLFLTFCLSVYHSLSLIPLIFWEFQKH